MSNLWNAESRDVKYYCEHCGRRTHCEFCDECLKKHAHGKINDEEESD